MNYDLNVRTRGEELWLWRRSRGLTAATGAERVGVGRTTMWKMEADQMSAPIQHPRWGLARVRRPPLCLLLALARRRAGLGLYRTAKRAGISHVSLLERERSGSPELVTFWKDWGFSFPE